MRSCQVSQAGNYFPEKLGMHHQKYRNGVREPATGGTGVKALQRGGCSLRRQQRTSGDLGDAGTSKMRTREGRTRAEAESSEDQGTIRVFRTSCLIAFVHNFFSRFSSPKAHKRGLCCMKSNENSDLRFLYLSCAFRYILVLYLASSLHAKTRPRPS